MQVQDRLAADPPGQQGVGRFAVQLAARAGAEVVALVGSPARGAGLRELGAAEVVTELTGEPLTGVLDNVGGPLLAEAFAHLEAGGVALAVGKASGEATTIDWEAERLRGGHRRLEPFVISVPLGDDLAYLARLLGRGELDPQVDHRVPWERATDAVDALLSRRIRGKAVLDLH
ncbi:zinc-binding dehydrogenase [Amycolatopsis magusensis]|uniref:zinc-binding dehydrogenase n=1 Tax=Amycolatopsis magusensis TaxID=882444 RepID=UPI0024A93AF3|nr:zinc-binding dehydrogenase [Amycolatopsis magusensis]MDI5981674.1 zinc-binding dehydrogenase [Amycolatopsis magusensis]